MTAPRCPRWLDKVGQSYWQKLSPHVDLADANKREQLALLCDNYSTYRAAAKQIHADGLTVPTENGGTKPHPSIKTRNDANTVIVRLSKLLAPGGDSPRPDTDELDDLLGDG